LTRSDHRYMGPHPVVWNMSRSHVYIPDGEDWGGINDRHSVFPRHLVDQRFAIHEELMTGKYKCDFVDEHEFLDIEAFMLSFYRNHSIPIKRYPAMQYLACCEKKHLTFTVDDKVYSINPETCTRYASEGEKIPEKRRKWGMRWRITELDEIVRRLKRACGG
jgi:hypothetical protein